MAESNRREAINSTDDSTQAEGNQTSENSLLKTKAELQIRDQGYAWVVLGAMFASNLLMFGYNRSFGIFATAMLAAYPDSSGTTIGLIMGLLVGCRNLFAPVIGTLSNKFGLRKSLFLGTTLFSVALLSSYFCTTMGQLSFTLGAMTGISQCIVQCSQVILSPQYFEKKFSFANGIRVASSPVGGFIFPFIVSVLIEYLGLRCAFIVMAGIISHLFVFSLLMRPIEKQMKIKAIEKTEQIFKDIYYEKNSEGELFIPNANNADNEEINSSEWNRVRTSRNENMKKLLYEEILLKNNHLLKKRPRKQLQFHYFKNVHYLMYILLSITIPLGLHSIVNYMVIYAQTEVGLSSYEVSIMLGFEAIFDFALRIFLGWINNKNLFPKSYGLMICLWISAAGVIFVPFATNLITLTVLIFVCSIGSANYVTSLNVMLCEDFGKENITSTWGFIRMMSGAFSFINSLLLGYIWDWSGSFSAPFFVMSGGTMTCGVIIGIQILLKRFTSSNYDRS